VVLVDREPFRSLAKTTPLLLVEGPLFRFADRDHFVRRWRPLIAEYFRPDREVVQRAAKTASLARRGRTHLFGVHVRRGDYKNFIGGRYFYEWDAYEQLMRGISETWGANQVAFLVCSDEPVPPDFAAGLTWTAGPGDILGDLEALGACDRLLSPPSSFSGWASFVADKPRYEIVELSHVPQPGDFVQSQG
jgi:hypothetical protein